VKAKQKDESGRVKTNTRVRTSAKPVSQDGTGSDVLDGVVATHADAFGVRETARQEETVASFRKDLQINSTTLKKIRRSPTVQHPIGMDGHMI
jgi:hypothetical protein